MKPPLQYKTYKLAVIVTVFVSLILFSASFWLGKSQLFLLLNNDLGLFADSFFKYYTNLGDGVIWIVLLVLFLIYQKKYTATLIFSFIICTLLVQVCKYVIVPNEPRPVSVIHPTSLMHVVSGVELHEISSFPSGHTAAAFSFFLIATLFVSKKWIVPMGFVYALLVGYSRVYLAQHFPFDVAAGMLVAVFSVSLAVYLQVLILNRKKTL